MSDNPGTVLWEWVVQEPDGSVGRVPAHIPTIGMAALSARSRYYAEKLRPLAKDYAMRTGKRVWLREFRMFADHEDA